jgi:hypothetical protein
LRLERRAAWLAACRWIAAETPSDALFWAKGEGGAFKWYAARAEYFSFKDCPQDARGIVAWRERVQQLFQWDQDQPRGRYSAAAMQQLHRATGIDYVVGAPQAFEPPPIYQNSWFAVYKLEQAPPASATDAVQLRNIPPE